MKNKKFNLINLFLTCLFFFNGCGTYSVIRPADNLKRGELEISGGITYNNLPELNCVAQINYGLNDWLEIGAQYEVYSTFVWSRFGLLNTDDHGIALAIGVGGGSASIIKPLDNDDTNHFSDAALLGSLTIGRQFGQFEPYFGYKFIPVFYENYTYTINVVKLGTRFSFHDNCFAGFEGGVSFHNSLTTVGECAISLGVKF